MQVEYKKIAIFDHVPLYLGNDTRQGHSYGTLICDLSSGAISNDLV